MRLKHLEASLSSLQREFPSPKIQLEQYPTSPHLAACVVQMAMDHDDLGPGRTCLDLGCGTGMLMIAAAMVDTDLVLGVDCDDEAMVVAMENVLRVEQKESVDFLKARVRTRQIEDSSAGSSLKPSSSKHFKGKRGGGGRGRADRSTGGRGSQPAQLTKAILIHDSEDGIPLKDNCVDTVLTNPPFGTKSDNAGIDLQFLRTATRLARRSVYSFHKRSTRTFLLKTIQKDWGFDDAKVVAEMAFDVPNMYKFHTQKSKDIEVDLIRIVVEQDGPVVATGDRNNNIAL
ncbi:methyltransferase [Nitzschia inconspicua]|uniref:Methyltransferase n=1 Tax=Nitzschia inconspicua TaxID=303405 RepID=A0A9K3PYR8_9STRA|nr:methyltransferase [Nitzschia inconspicua]